MHQEGTLISVLGHLSLPGLLTLTVDHKFNLRKGCVHFFFLLQCHLAYWLLHPVLVQ